MNEAEQFVSELCQHSFLSLWTYPNPRGKKSQELCDVLVVCDPDILVISVKEIEFKNTDKPEVDLIRWQKKAVKESVKQVFGAERRLGLVDTVTTNDGSMGLHLPNLATRKIHRIAVAIGGENKVPIASRTYENKGEQKFVHVFDRISFRIIMQELDTITDFVRYLRARKELNAEVLMEGEEDMLALYLPNGRVFSDHDVICIEGGYWNELVKHPQYIRGKKENKISYKWDKLIEKLSQRLLNNKHHGNSDLNNAEKALRIMAREDRFTRRGLAKSFIDFFEKSYDGKTRARILTDPGLATYVFLASKSKCRNEALAHRCIVARYLHPQKTQVIGISTDNSNPLYNSSGELFYFDCPMLTPELKSFAKMAHEKGIFKKTTYYKGHEEEFPI